MTNIKVLINKISDVEKYFLIIKRYRKYLPEEIEKNIDLLGATERYLYLLCQSVIDLGEAILSYYSFRTPANYGEIFMILKENDLINEDIEKKMIKMAGFRNILAHAYGKIDNKVLFEVLQKNSNDVMSFLNKIKEKIS